MRRDDIIAKLKAAKAALRARSIAALPCLARSPAATTGLIDFGWSIDRHT